jgi:PIN domain nuclease of toxin-antitoxin system
VNVLLDTCALLALARGALPDRAGAALRSAPEAYVSVVSPWEVAIKAAGGKLRLAGPALQWFQGLAERHDLREIPLDARTACAAALLPPIHRDPFDRILVALAQARTLTVLTSDDVIPTYPGVRALWSSDLAPRR